MDIVETHKTYRIKVDQIYADEVFNCRGKIQPLMLVDLANSIKDHKLQIPVIVWECDNLPDGCRFLLVAGYRRYFACTKLLKHTEILATIRTDLTDETARILNFTENLERKDLNILEEARAIDISFPASMSHRAVGRALNRSGDWVIARRALLRLSEEAQNYAAQGLLKISDIKMLASLTSKLNRSTLLKKIVEARKNGRIPYGKDAKTTARHHLKQVYSRPSISELQEVISYLAERSLGGIATKLLLFALGRLTIDQIKKQIDEVKDKYTKRNCIVFDRKYYSED